MVSNFGDNLVANSGDLAKYGDVVKSGLNSRLIVEKLYTQDVSAVH